MLSGKPGRFEGKSRQVTAGHGRAGDAGLDPLAAAPASPHASLYGWGITGEARNGGLTRKWWRSVRRPPASDGAAQERGPGQGAVAAVQGGWRRWSLFRRRVAQSGRLGLRPSAVPRRRWARRLPVAPAAHAGAERAARSRAARLGRPGVNRRQSRGPLHLLVPVRASSVTVRVVLVRLCFQALVSPSYVTVPLRSLPPLLPDPPPAGIFVCTALNKVLLLPAVAADSAFGRSVHESSAAEAAVRHPSRSRDARAGLGDSAGGYGRV